MSYVYIGGESGFVNPPVFLGTLLLYGYNWFEVRYDYEELQKDLAEVLDLARS